MTLRELIEAVESAAQGQPAVATVVPNDVFRLNAMPEAKYGVFAWTQQQHRADVASGLVYFQLTLFYVDRLTPDKSNEVQVQSTGVSVLSNVVRTVLLDQSVDVSGDVTFQTFNQRFVDECAGVFSNVTFIVPGDDLCAQEF